ncbi:MAG: HEPN domain-containing protein [Ignavibacterium sp.]|nr:HEPN domain-containing protein [Ignavibacterium sp.]
MQVDRIELIKYRLNRASETLEEAKISIENKRYLLAANRIYYASFYAVSTLAIKHEFKTSKHAQLLSWFNKTFVKTEIIEKRLGKFYLDAFEMRQESDYEDFVVIDKTSIDDKLKLASEFIDKISKLL